MWSKFGDVRISTSKNIFNIKKVKVSMLGVKPRLGSGKISIECQVLDTCKLANLVEMQLCISGEYKVVYFSIDELVDSGLESYVDNNLVEHDMVWMCKAQGDSLRYAFASDNYELMEYHISYYLTVLWGFKSGYTRSLQMINIWKDICALEQHYFLNKLNKEAVTDLYNIFLVTPTPQPKAVEHKTMRLW